MAQIFPIDFEEKTTMAQDDYILFSDSEDGNKIKKAQYSNLKGEKGDPGTPGTPGTPGKDGEDGESATITVGSVSTLPAGSSATVTNSGTTSAAVLDFGIPEGATGAPGKDGEDGEDGTAATITVGTTTTLPAGSSATVENVGTSQDAILNFGIPKGDSGTGTGDVIGPASSTDGHLAVFDGATGKIIKDGGAVPTVPTKVSELSNDSGFITGIDSGDVTTALGYTPADSANLGTAASKNTGTSSGNVPVLDSNGKLANSTLPGVALTDTFTVSTSSDLTTLSSAEQGDLAIVTSENKTYVLSQAPYSTASNWKQILSPTGGVTSVNGQTGAVTVSEFTPGGTATTGYVVTKTASGYEWKAPTGGIAVDSASPIQLTKIWAGTQAQYDALGSYDATTVYLTI